MFFEDKWVGMLLWIISHLNCRRTRLWRLDMHQYIVIFWLGFCGPADGLGYMIPYSTRKWIPRFVITLDIVFGAFICRASISSFGHLFCLLDWSVSCMDKTVEVRFCYVQFYFFSVMSLCCHFLLCLTGNIAYTPSSCWW